jgi:hypothetical protein
MRSEPRGGRRGVEALAHGRQLLEQLARLFGATREGVLCTASPYPDAMPTVARF